MAKNNIPAKTTWSFCYINSGSYFKYSCNQVPEAAAHIICRLRFTQAFISLKCFPYPGKSCCTPSPVNVNTLFGLQQSSGATLETYGRNTPHSK